MPAITLMLLLERILFFKNSANGLIQTKRPKITEKKKEKLKKVKEKLERLKKKYLMQ